MSTVSPEWIAALGVFVGGGIGSVARFWVNVHVRPAVAAAALPPGIPWPTLLVNVVGSLLIGVVYAALADHPRWRLFLATGCLGGLTTYSAFAYEIVALLHEGHLRSAVVYLLVTTTACLLACEIGLLAGGGYRHPGRTATPAAAPK